ncbi:MAG: hypothetical protein RQ966_20270 [Acetobacteraceae bacterium]|nr:hypothetical protein [Acetobacteraceae bacterium]
MSDNPFDPSPAFQQRVDTLAQQLFEADGSPAGRLPEYRERADELARMELAGPAGLIDPEAAPAVVVEEASIQENLGEFPSGQLGDQGRFLETPMTRDKELHTDEADLPEGGTSA